MATTNAYGWVPTLAGLLAQAPEGVNPFQWYADRFAAAANPDIAPWSKPLFYIVGIVSMLNIPAVLFLLYYKYRKDGSIRMYQMREHRSGGRYICLNSSNVFLVTQLLTAAAFSMYPFLHIHTYHVTGKAWMDVAWASMVWIAPYLSLIMTSIGCIYGILVAPSPFSYAKRGVNGDLIPARSPLSSLPCWMLNGFVVLAPTILIATVLGPAITLTIAVKRLEMQSITSWDMIATMAVQFDDGIVPAVADQVALLQSLSSYKAFEADAIAGWRPCFAMWTAWCGLGFLFALPAFVAVYRVTKTRLRLAQQNGGTTVDSGVLELSELKSRPSQNRTLQQTQIAQARSEHYNLSIQFASAAVLLAVAGVALLFDVIVGWRVHKEPTLLAVGLLVPMMSYTVQASVAVVLIFLRVWSGQNPTLTGAASAGSPQISPSRSVRSRSHTRTDSDQSMVETKRDALFPHTLAYSGSQARRGQVFVSDADEHSFPVSPSVVHQINIEQTQIVQVDEEQDGDFESTKDGSALDGDWSTSISQTDLVPTPPLRGPSPPIALRMYTSEVYDGR